MPVTIQQPLPLTFTVATLADTCFTTEQERAEAIAGALIGSLPNNASMVIAGNGTPTASNEASGGPWIRYDNAGNFDRVYAFQNGRWRSRHPLAVGAIILWSGALADIPTIDGGTAGTATADSGPFWEEYTAARGRVAVHPDTSKTVLQFQTGLTNPGAGNSVGVGTTGGEERHQLSVAELPVHDHSIANLNQNTTVTVPGAVTSLFPWSFIGGASTTTTPAGSNTPHNNVQPFIGVFLIKRTIREFYVI